MEIASRVKEIIMPSSPSPQISIKLNSFDRIAPRFYVPFLLFFKNFSISSQHLKLSLSKTLSVFYPLAGRYKVLPDQGLEIHCCDHGVEFFEALASGSLDEAVPAFRRFNPLNPALAPCDLFPIDLENVPLLSIQLTRFSCGGACLQVAVHHLAMDGIATAYFLGAWGKVSSGQERFVHPPLLDRSLPRPADYSIPPDSVPAGLRIGEPLIGSSADPITVAFSNCAIQSMLPRSNKNDRATRFEILAAHLWIAVTRARATLSVLTPQDETKLGFTVDGRTRFDPPLPDGFLGNAFFIAIATANVGTLLDEPIDYAVRLIQAAKSMMTHRYMAAAAAWIESRSSMDMIFPSLSPDKADFIVSSWQRLEIGLVNFGCGKPDFVGGLVPGICTILPEVEGDDHRLIAAVSLDPKQRVVFEQSLSTSTLALR